MKKIGLYVVMAALSLSCAPIFAVDSENAALEKDIIAYDAGGSMYWYYKAFARIRKGDPTIECQLLKSIDSGKLSYEALRLCCKLLKECATENSIEPMVKLIKEGKPPVLACEVLLAVQSDKADKALCAILEANKTNPPVRDEIIITLGKRNKARNLPVLIEFAKSKDLLLARAAINSIGQIDSRKSVDALAEVLRAGFSSENSFYIYDALCMQARLDLKTFGFFQSRARRALSLVPQNFAPSIGLRAELLAADERIKYLDSIMVQGGDLGKVAGKYTNSGRTYENSKILIDAYPRLSVPEKMSAIRSFAESGDPRFYSVFKDDFDSANKDLRRSAIFAARFICWGNKEAVEKLMALAKDADKDIAAIATDVLVEMKGQMVDVLLWDNPDFSKVMILRGSKDHLEALWNRFFTDEGIKDREVSQMVEQTLMWHNLRAFVEKMNSFAKEEYRMAAAKIITKKLALLRDKDNMQRIANEALQGVVRADDEVAKFISSKLKISLDKLG